MVRINLIPKGVQFNQARRARLQRWGVTGVVAVGALAIAFGVDVAHRASAEQLRTEREQLEADLGKIRKDLRSISAEANQALLRLERAKALRAKRAWSGMIALIGEQMPQDCWLVSLATDPTAPTGGPAIGRAGFGAPNRSGQRAGDEASAAVAIEAPRKLSIAGYAPRAAQPYLFVTALKRTGVFTRVFLERSRRQPVLDGFYFRFDLSCEW